MQAGKFVSASEINELPDGDLFPCFGGNGLRGFTKSFNHDGKYPLIGRQGALCGNVTLTNGKFYATEHAVVVTSNKNMDTVWMYYLLLHLNLNQYATGQAQPGLSIQTLEKVETMVPSSKLEQQKIASFLSILDDKISAQRKIIENLSVLKATVAKKIFSQQLRFRKFTDKWESKRLGEVGEIVSGLTYSPNDIDQRGVLVLRSSNVQNRTLVFDDNVFVNANSFNAVLENDILICVRNGSKNLIGKNAIIKKEHEGFAFGAFMAVYRSPYNNFLFHWFDTEEYKEEVHKNLGATINSINGSDLKKFKVPFPKEAEQQRIASFLFTINQKMELETTILEKLTQQKEYLLKQMFI